MKSIGMNVINAGFDFNSVPTKNQLSFKSTPRKGVLYPGNHLYRFITPGENVLLSSFWYGEQSFQALLDHCRRGKVPIQEVARARLAFKREWNPEMTHKMQAQPTSAGLCMGGAHEASTPFR